MKEGRKEGRKQITENNWLICWVDLRAPHEVNDLSPVLAISTAETRFFKSLFSQEQNGGIQQREPEWQWHKTKKNFQNYEAFQKSKCHVHS